MFSQATLGLFTGKKRQISLPTYILQLVKSLPFHILEAHQGLAYMYFWRHSDHSSVKSMEELWSPGFGIAFMDGTRNLALLWNRIRELVTLKPLDPGFLTAKIFKIYSTLAVSNDWKTGNLSWAFPPRWHAAAVRQRSVRQETTMERVGTLLPSYLRHREVQQGISVSLEPAGKWGGRRGTGDKDDQEGVLEYLSTICLAAMKIQKNSHLVMTTTKVTMMLVTSTHLWTARPTSCSERFPGLEKLFESATCCWGSKNDSK